MTSRTAALLIATILSLSTLPAAPRPAAAADPLPPLAPEGVTPVTCFARVSSSGVIYSDPTSLAIQHAVEDAVPNDLVKVAGYCPDWSLRLGQTQSVMITQTLTLRGGYSTADWAVSNPILNPTIVKPSDTSTPTGARAVFIAAGVYFTIENITLVDGGWGMFSLTGPGGNIFHSGASLLVDNVTLDNGYAGYGGGLYSAGGPVMVRGSRITSGEAITAGGGIYNNGGVMAVEKTEFSSNVAGRSGAGVHTQGGILTVTNSALLSNAVTSGSGGGIDAQLNARTTVTATEFASNSATNGGGINQGSGSLTVVDSTLHNNIAANQGAGILAGAGTIVAITNSTLEKNGASGVVGGGLASYGARVSLTRTFVLSNAATTGAGLLLAAGINEVVDTVIGANESDGSGAGLWVADGATYLTRTAVANNLAGGNGGGLYVGSNLEPELLSLRAVTITENAADGNSGGGMYLGPITRTLWITGSDVAIAKNNALLYGGGVYATGPYTLSLQDFRVVGNATLNSSAAGVGGGGLLLSTTPTGGAWALLTDGVIADNRSPNPGGGLDAVSIEARLTRVRVEGNAAHSGGGVIIATGSRPAQLFIASSVISGNTTNTGGGGGVWNNGAALVAITGTQILSNVAKSVGGGLLSSASTPLASFVAVTNSTVATNTSVSSGGGGIYSQAFLRLKDSSVVTNTAPNEAGGGVYNAGAGLEVIGGVIADNVAKLGGGGIAQTLNSTVLLSATHVAFNSATGAGAQAGGVLNLSGMLAAQDTRIDHNVSTGSGGGVFSTGSSTFDRVSIDANISNQNGGGLYSTGSTRIRDSVVASNRASLTAVAYAGGLYLEAPALVANSVISGNRAGYGAGLAMTNSVQVYDSAVYGNQAVEQVGGAFMVFGGALTVSRTAVYSNSASGTTAPVGGAGYVQGGAVVRLINATVSGNAAGNSSAFHVVGGSSLWMTATTLANNTSLLSPPAIAFSVGASVRATQSLFAGGSGCAAPISDGGYNVDIGASCFSAPTTTLINQAGALVNPLAFNGGSNPYNWTHSLPAVNPALSLVPFASCQVADDQRGVTRPQPATSSRCDAGAYESDVLGARAWIPIALR